MERTQKLINALRRANKLFTGTKEQNARANHILEWLEDNVTANDLEWMNEEEYHLFECYELGFDSDCNYNEGCD
jgi:hypothetical protein